VTTPPATWRTALSRIPTVRRGKWAVGGSAALALHGLPVVPRDLDLIVDQSAAAELILELGDAVMTDEWSWDRGDVKAVRRALAVVSEFDVEILVGVETVAGGVTLLGPPNLDDVVVKPVGGRPVPVLPLPTMLTLLRVTGDHERAAVVLDAIRTQEGN
jgi:hypothetical protein